jgi:hypothetical protein
MTMEMADSSSSEPLVWLAMALNDCVLNLQAAATAGQEAAVANSRAALQTAATTAMLVHSTVT